MDEVVWTRPTQYILRECLGEGTMGRVYAAVKQDLDLGVEHHVAVKFLKSRKAVSFIRQEIQTLSQVQSVFCVRFLNWEWINGRPALITELISGLNLRELAMIRNLSGDEVLEIGRQIQAGLQDLENQGNAHGDLSPTNVLITTEGQVKLVDFGLAGYRRETLGTIRFLAPELVGGGTPNFKSDLFSLGCLLRSFLHANAQEDLSSLLQLSPEKRSPMEIVENPAVREVLATRVREAIRIKEYRPETAINLEMAATKNKREDLRRFLMALVLLTATLTAVRSSSEVFTNSVRDSSLSKVSIRTKKWVRVFIDGVDAGFAPLERVEVRPGAMQIRWEGALGRGEGALTLRAREHIVLSDSFFEK